MRRSVAVLAAVALVYAPAAAAWSWPVDGPVVHPFVFGDDPFAADQHRGIDIGAAPGTPVRAASAGTVSFAGTVPAGGRTVTVETADGLSVTYLELGAIRVTRDAEVVEGDAIGTVGSAAHVHFGVRVTEDQHGYRDPLLFLPARVEAPARTDPVEASPPAAAQPDPVEPTAEAAATAKAATPTVAVSPEPNEPPSAVTEPAEAPSAAVAGDSASDAQAETPGQAAATARSAKRLVPEAESDGTESPAAAAEGSTTAAGAVGSTPVAAAEGSTPVARPRPAVPRSNATPKPARTTAKRQAELPSTPADASFVATPSHEAAERGAPVSGRHRAADGAAARHGVRPRPRSAGARLAEPPAVRPARIQAEAAWRNAAWPRTELVLASLALAMLGAAAAAAAAVRRRRPTVRPEREPGEAARRVEAECCPVGRVRAPHVIHSCARAQEPGWLSSPAAARRRTALARRSRPLPRPRRRALAHTGT
jgi:hypothetical protein